MEGEENGPSLLSPGEGRAAVGLARAAVERRLGLGEYAEATGVPGFKRGAFVTIEQSGELRGCMGIPLPRKPIDRAVVESAEMAAFEDPRFPQLSAGETELVTFQVTVLTPPREASPEEVEVGRHGLLLRREGRSGLLLPQVAVEKGWAREEFLGAVCRKAGLPRDSWRDADLKVFRGQIFEEAEPRGEIEGMRPE